MPQEKVILAYSGGLDTSCILKWLLQKNYEVICCIADVGQKEDFEEVQRKALGIGAKSVIVKSCKNTFVKNYVWPAIGMGLIYEERYLLGTSLARPCITVALVEVAKHFNAKYIAHGATGKGNDQVRFELCAYALYPDIQIIAPWRDDEFCKQFQGRKDLLAFAETHNIPVSAKPSSPWSTDANILHISYESGILEDPDQVAPSSLFEMTRNPQEISMKLPVQIEIQFKEGLPISVKNLSDNDLCTKDPVPILEYLNEIGGSFGIGRIDIVENRFVGLKSRGVYETPGGTILFKAHQDLEIFSLDREVLRLKQYLRDRMADFVYNGFWFSPEAEYVRKCIEISQKYVCGKVKIELAPGYCHVISRCADQKGSLYNEQLVSMDSLVGYESSDAGGFIAINAVRICEFARAFKNYSVRNE